ncbi:hypothetical protein B0H94_10455 [Salsuginibacillus halophilus]|uniref:Cytosolic protein n=1 Tax=Salsuginibacillus halophilus TaxID=517424 RepID=A0A2P8HQH0_9BACI|nr:DUF6282 family protein [Salsuginibacillus halophilus]PSL48455.1 hypothetical protein B0H94_10455 [Salsuginibacillus halophilus]
MKTTYPFLQGGFELHVHSAPSLFPRVQNDWELLEDAREAGMAGVVIKSHEAQTYDRASIVQAKTPDLAVRGGVALNESNGGLSPAVVDMALRLGAAVIWMPTTSAAQHKHYYNQGAMQLGPGARPLAESDEGLTILDEHDRVKPEVYTILELIAQQDAVLATGHLSFHEVERLVEAAQGKGVKKILIQHTDLGIARVPKDLEATLVKKGCWVEKCYLAASPDFQDTTVEAMAASIQDLGRDNCVLVTDYGQAHNLPPVKALGEFTNALHTAGVPEQDIEHMMKHNPRHLLGLS